MSSFLGGSKTPMNSPLPEIDVINSAKRGDGTQQAKHDIETTRHAQRLPNADCARCQQAENDKSQHGVPAICGLDVLALLLCLCGHKMCGLVLLPNDQDMSHRRLVTLIAQRNLQHQRRLSPVMC